MENAIRLSTVFFLPPDNDIYLVSGKEYAYQIIRGVDCSVEYSTVSYWNLTGEKYSYSRLENNLETDILIIGGGITGITCAYCLTQKGLKPTVIEAGGLCDGTTGNTTGKVTIQHDIIYSKIMEKYGKDFAGQYCASQTEALEFVRQAVKNESIDCQFYENTAYVYASLENDLEIIKKEFDTAKELGIECELIDKPNFPPENFGMLGFKNQAVFHSVRYVESLAKIAVSRGAKIYTNTKAYKIDNERKSINVFCDNGIEISTSHLVMATQYPVYDGPNLFYTRLYPKRTYGIAVKTKRDWPDGSYINVSGSTRSIRTHVENGQKVLIVVGDGHTTGRSDVNMDEHLTNLIEFAEGIAGVDRIYAKWSAQDYDTPDQIPYIGRISDKSNIYIASGFRKWGLSNGTLAGILISELIKDGNCRYEELYSRKRADYSRSLGKTITEVGLSVYELIKSKLEGTESIQDLKQGEGRVIRFEGKRAGIYRDFDDSVIILDITCTHMGTELNYNSAERTWDCPAHGGRYNIEGVLLEGPPKNNLKVLYKGQFSDLYAEK